MTIRGDWIDTEILFAEDLNDTFNNIVDTEDIVSGTVGVNGTLSYPIGSVIGWLKTFTNTPALTVGWVQCDGQVLSDAQSPFNGVTLPNLNSTNRFLKGTAASGTTGGSTSHTHYMSAGWYGYTGAYNYGHPAVPAWMYGADGSPPYYDIVWIMRIK